MRDFQASKRWEFFPLSTLCGVITCFSPRAGGVELGCQNPWHQHERYSPNLPPPPLPSQPGSTSLQCPHNDSTLVFASQGSYRCHFGAWAPKALQFPIAGKVNPCTSMGLGTCGKLLPSCTSQSSPGNGAFCRKSTLGFYYFLFLLLFLFFP